MSDLKRLLVPEFYGDLVYISKKIGGTNYFQGSLLKMIYHYKMIGYNTDVL